MNFAFRNGTLLSDAQRRRHILRSFADPMRPALRQKNLSADSLEYTTFLLKPLDFEQDDAGDGEDGGLDQGRQQRRTGDKHVGGQRPGRKLPAGKPAWRPTGMWRADASLEPSPNPNPNPNPNALPNPNPNPDQAA